MWGDILTAFAIAFLISFMTTPYTIKLANILGAVDDPNDERRINKVKMPRLGGLAVILGFLISITYLLITLKLENKIDLRENDILTKLVGFVLGGLIIIITCFLDDIKGLKPLVKLVAQILAAIVVIKFGIVIDTAKIPFLNGVESLRVYQFITLCWIIGITNAINLIDGLDGLSTGICLISCVSLLQIFSLNNSPFISILLITGLVGALAGFLPYNFNPAKTFIGDTGSNFLGYSIACISILGIAKTYTAIVIVAPIIILALPIFDTIFAIIRRFVKGHSLSSIMKPDANHIHHKMLKAGFSQKQSVLIMYGITALLGLFVVIWIDSGMWKAISFAIIVLLTILIGHKEFIKQNTLNSKEEKKEKEK